jgi:FtsZ-interacting cell division protein ZipA
MAKSDGFEQRVAAQTRGDQVNKGLIAAFVGVVAIAAIVAGCGGSSDDETSSLTKTQFIAQADAICKKGNTEIESEVESFAEKNGIEENEEPSKAQQAEVSETILAPNIENQAEEIRALEAPSGDEDEVSAMLDSLEEGVEEVEANPQAPFESKQPNPFGAANKLAGEYGLRVCGQG